VPSQNKRVELLLQLEHKHLLSGSLFFQFHSLSGSAPASLVAIVDQRRRELAYIKEISALINSSGHSPLQTTLLVEAAIVQGSDPLHRDVVLRLDVLPERVDVKGAVLVEVGERAGEEGDS